MVGDGGVAAAAYDFSIFHHYRAYWHLASFSRKLCQLKRNFHELLIR
jgi:hypothetical protein